MFGVSGFKRFVPDFFAVEILLHWRKLSPSETLASAAGLPLTSSLYLKPKQNHVISLDPENRGFPLVILTTSLLLYTVGVSSSLHRMHKDVVFKPSEEETILSVNLDYDCDWLV
ncbi:hypothetical protein QL285_092563 [Trifolium repens]|nr:hypothetical protein QL285_092563 [Trifolium repens]